MAALSLNNPGSRMVNEWLTARAALAAIERAEHPDITDRYDRVWVWRGKTLYAHCGNAAPLDMINSFGLPTQRALDNPNYDPCAICLDGRTRNAPVCKPEWDCTHKWCADARTV